LLILSSIRMSITTKEGASSLHGNAWMEPLISAYWKTPQLNKMELHLIENIFLEYVKVAEPEVAELVLSSILTRICPHSIPISLFSCR